MSAFGKLAKLLSINNLQTFTPFKQKSSFIRNKWKEVEFQVDAKNSFWIHVIENWKLFILLIVFII
jgi:hypothetical protein